MCGELPAAEAASHVARLVEDDLGYARVDRHRAYRRGRPEAIFGAGKTAEQIIAIARSLGESGRPVIVTRVAPSEWNAVRAALDRPNLREIPQVGYLAIPGRETPVRTGTVAVLCAGTTDIGVAEEAAVTAEILGSPVERYYDVGVAGIHRLLRHREALQRARVLVVVAGMEGALPSVVAGLVAAPVIAVPTSVGYGAAFEGMAALLGMLTACAPGITVVNIDNGFGAGYVADVINAQGTDSQHPQHDQPGETHHSHHGIC
jgi:pyridinium-3,5-biscarboxylic acid mononucleotide synthase